MQQTNKNTYTHTECYALQKCTNGQVDLLRDHLSVSCLSEAGRCVLIPNAAFETSFLAEEHDVFVIVIRH